MYDPKEDLETVRYALNSSALGGAAFKRIETYVNGVSAFYGTFEKYKEWLQGALNDVRADITATINALRNDSAEQPFGAKGEATNNVEQLSVRRARIAATGKYPPMSPSTMGDLLDNIGRVRSMLETQGQPGNWNVNEYMRGMYNGLELAVATLEGRAVAYREGVIVSDMDQDEYDGYFARGYNQGLKEKAAEHAAEIAAYVEKYTAQIQELVKQRDSANTRAMNAERRRDAVEHAVEKTHEIVRAEIVAVARKLVEQHIGAERPDDVLTEILRTGRCRVTFKYNGEGARVIMYKPDCVVFNSDIEKFVLVGKNQTSGGPFTLTADDIISFDALSQS